MENTGYRLEYDEVAGATSPRGVYRQSERAVVIEEKPQVAANGQAHEKAHAAPEAGQKVAAAAAAGGHPIKKRVYEKRVSFFGLFRFADRTDVCLMLMGTLGAICTGAATPFNLYLFGNMITKFVSVERNLELQKNIQATAQLLNAAGDGPRSCLNNFIENGSANWNLSSTSSSNGTDYTVPSLFDIIVGEFVVIFCALAGGVLILSYMSMCSWVYTAERQIRRIRMAYFKSVMNQHMGWFDTYAAGELNTRMSDDLDRLHDGFGDKMATFLQWMTTFVGGFCVGFIEGWQLALIILAVSPLLAISSAVMGRVMRTFVQKELKAYAKAGGVATEVLTAIRTVTAFGGQNKAANKYKGFLVEASHQGIKKAFLAGIMGGVIWILVFSTFALAFWYGAKLVREDCLDTGVVLQVFMGVFIGSMSFGNAAPLLENFANARGAAAELFDIIDKKSKIDGSTGEGETPQHLHGNIEFENVRFAYPARPDITIMTDTSLCIKPGQKVAIVGPSGCGKSTLVQLVQRFYDPLDGRVKLDGKDLRSLNIRWLRSNIGVVGQEPVLFSASIEENIRLGGTNVKEEDIIRACKAANCYEFIMQLPQKLQTLVGERGAQLSGGQKQRIAIARALVSDPRILLLDEATSALDTQSELVVQEALDKASKGRTTIIVAHRLSTVKNADVIFGLKDDGVVEFGTHGELMKRQGLYFSLHTMQKKRKSEDVEEEEKEEEEARDRATSSATSSSQQDSSEEQREKSHFRRSQRRESAARDSQRQSQGQAFSRAGSSPGERQNGGGGGSFIRASIRSMQEGTRAALAAMQSRPVDADAAAEQDEASQDELKMAVEQEKSNVDIDNVQMGRIYRLNRPELTFIITGCTAAMLSGAIQPTFAVLMSEMIGVIGLTLDPDDQNEKVTFWCLIMVAVGLGSAVTVLVKNAMFGISGERLTERLRLLSFQTMLNQEIGWFDEQRNQVGILTARLATDASQIKGAAGVRLAVVLQALATIGFALAISYIYCWQLALVMMFFMPLSVSSGIVQQRVLKGFAKSDKDAMEEGGKIAQEAISNIRTVVSLNKEEYFVEKFNAHFKKLYQRDRTKSLVAGIAYSCSQSLVFLGFAICYSYGSYLVDTTRYTEYPVQFYYILRVFSAINFGGASIGQAVAAAPDYITAKVAAAKMLALFDRKPLINSSDNTGKMMTSCEGNIDFSDVTFRYPSRPTVPILRGFTVSVKKGEKLALVGASGCGKSTAVSLLERFYDPTAGCVTLDGLALSTIKIQDLRKVMGIVSQEPLLFDTTVAENIAYGDNTRHVPISEIIEAARNANIHEFISSLPQGYDTHVGDKGTQLSGGQKQRIAIARALVRNPRVLLLDEATSALDAESEKVVQEALENAQRGRTCIVIAHRLSTVKDADRIAVIHHGQVAEIGTHDELLARGKLYYKLVNAQL